MKQLLRLLVCVLLATCTYGQVKKPAPAKTTPPNQTAKPTLPNNQEEKDRGQIQIEAKEQLDKLKDLLNFISTAQYDDDIDNSIAGSYSDTGDPIFKNERVIIEDDIDPDFDPAKPIDKSVINYLLDLKQFYSKKQTKTIQFSGIGKMADVKKEGGLYKFTLYFKSEFLAKNKFGKPYKASHRIAEFEAEKSLDGFSWKVFITGIRFLPSATTVATKTPELFKARETPSKPIIEPQVAKKEEPKPPLITEKKEEKPAIVITEKKAETKPKEEKPFLVTERKEEKETETAAKEEVKPTPPNAIVAPEKPKAKVLVSMAPDDPVAAQQAQAMAEQKALQAEKAAEQLKMSLNKPSEPDLSGRARTASIIKIVLAGAAAVATVTTFIQLQKSYNDYKAQANALNQDLSEWQSLSRRIDVGKPLDVMGFSTYAKPGIYGVYAGGAATIGLTFSALQSLGKARESKIRKKK